MNADLRLGRIAGIEISVNWSVLVLVVLLVSTLASGIFPSTNPHLSARAHLAMAIAATAAFLCALLLHELGHALQAQRDGIEIDGITLWLFGGVARFKRAYPSAGAEFRVALAGPLVSALLGVIAVLIAGASVPQAVGAVAAWLGYINLSLFVFNMLPALPLDGGRILHAILWRIKGDETAATRVAADIGRAFAYLFITGGLLLFVFQGSFGGAWLAFIGWFLLQGANAESRYVLTRQALSGLRVRDVMTRDPVTVAPDETVEQVIDETIHQHRHTTYPVVENGSAVGLLPFASIARVPRWDWGERHVRDCMLPRADVPVLTENETAVDALAEVSSSDVGRALVVSDGHLVGLLAASDLARVLDARPRGRQALRA
jgi:Zn-dependent protease